MLVASSLSSPTPLHLLRRMVACSADRLWEQSGRVPLTVRQSAGVVPRRVSVLGTGGSGVSVPTARSYVSPGRSGGSATTNAQPWEPVRCSTR